jgi:hypothetical protein
MAEVAQNMPNYLLPSWKSGHQHYRIRIRIRCGNAGSDLEDCLFNFFQEAQCY